MWQQLFGLTNAVALVACAVLLLGPRRWLGQMRVAGVGLLCMVYAVLVVLLIAGLVDPVRDGPAPAMTDYSVRGLRALFASDGAIVVGWTHYLALDLLAGTWIAEEADWRGLSRVTQVPMLLLTFLAGPLGVLTWLAISRGRGMGRPRR